MIYAKLAGEIDNPVILHYALIEAAKTLRSPTTRPVEVSSCPPDDWFRAQDIYSQLRSLAI